MLHFLKYNPFVYVLTMYVFSRSLISSCSVLYRIEALPRRMSFDANQY